jgi:hypothetical protein
MHKVSNPQPGGYDHHVEPLHPSAVSCVGPKSTIGNRPERLRRAGNWGIIALALAATYICFGTSPADTKAALDSLPPLLIMAGSWATFLTLCHHRRIPNR